MRLQMLLSVAALCAACLCSVARADELDLSLLVPDSDQYAAVSASPDDVLDLSILGCEPVSTAPASDTLDLTILGCQPSAKPTGNVGAGLDTRATDRLLPAVNTPLPATVNYPTRSNVWTHPGSGREALLTHLQSGEHAGKWDARWLATLSTDQLEALHSDDHEHVALRKLTSAIADATVPSAPKPASKPDPPKPVATVQQVTTAPRSNCPGGVCPTYNYSSNYSYQKQPRARKSGGLLQRVFGG